nr:IS110 family transposase [Leptospira mayottensis]
MSYKGILFGEISRLLRRPVPRVDISGGSVYYGRIVSRGYHSIRRVIVQAAWSLVRCQYGGKIKRIPSKNFSCKRYRSEVSYIINRF